MESYFDQVRGASVQDGLSEALLKTCIQSAPVALAHPDDYEARANLMWAASLAINGLNSLGKNRDVYKRQERGRTFRFLHPRQD